jgi:restriction endonuclease S subunit
MLDNQHSRMTLTLGQVISESTERLGRTAPDMPVYGVDRAVGLTATAKYVSNDLHRYKRLLPGMFAYNPMRLNIGSIGYCSSEHRPGLVSPDYVVFRCNPTKLNPDFLKYYIRSSSWRGWTEASGVGSVRVRIYFGELAQMPISLPTIEEQEAIVRVLGALDEKIDLNQQMSETLEAIESELFAFREQSEDWDEVPLGEICSIYDGPHATPPLSRSGPIFLGISNLADGLLDLANVNRITDEDFIKWTRRVTPAAGDVVFSYETRLGQAAIVPDKLKCCLGRRMGLLRPKDGKIVGNVLLRAFLGDRFQETIRQRTIHGSTVDRIPLKEMSEFLIYVPQGDAMSQLAAQLAPMRSLIENNERNKQTLTALRDTLLPKLISGELCMKNTERHVEAVL